MSRTRGKSRPVAERLAEIQEKEARLARQAALESLEANPANAAILAPSQEAIKVAQRTVNDSKRFQKIGPDKVQNFEERAQEWRDRIITANDELPSQEAELAQAKAEYNALVDSLLSQGQGEEASA